MCVSRRGRGPLAPGGSRNSARWNVSAPSDCRRTLLMTLGAEPFDQACVALQVPVADEVVEDVLAGP